MTPRRAGRTAALVALWLSCFVLVHLAVSPAFAQKTPQPTVKFSLDFPGSEPEHYAITVSADGRSIYESNGKLTDQSDADQFRLEFQMSAETRARIFELTKKAHDFEGDIDSGKKVAFTGSKTLSYSDGKKNTRAAYNYSLIPEVEELTTLFQNISTTLEFGRRLQFEHHYQKLALDDELTKMQDMQQSNNLDELAAVAPILQAIVQDTSVMRTSRARAVRLLQAARTPSTP